jgi:acetate kinase
MAHADHACILTINGGSSSIKFALFRMEKTPERLFTGSIVRIGLPDATLTVKQEETSQTDRRQFEALDQKQGVDQLISWLDQNAGFTNIAAVGHRIVHGGSRYSKPQFVTPELTEELRRLIPIDPPHLPGEIALIEAFTRFHPRLPQVACFDTAFHRTMPRVARLLPIPRRYESAGVERYGFHGLSYAYLMKELTRVAGPDAASGRVILAHLGAGASLAAVRNGRSLDTSMGFTPTAGLVMGTRSGDLDPGLLVYLMRQENLTADQVDELVNKHCGLLGISETTSDMRELLDRQRSDPRAADAVALFCYQAKKWIGAFSAALGGLDTLVFAGGIGEKSPEIRSRLCEGLEFLGLRLDQSRNGASAAIISAEDSKVTARVIPTDEEIMIAKLVIDLLEHQPQGERA